MSAPVTVTQADRDFADALAMEGQRLLRGIYRQELAEGIAMYRLATEAAFRAREAEYHKHLTDLCAEVYAGEGNAAFLAAMEFLSARAKAPTDVGGTQ